MKNANVENVNVVEVQRITESVYNTLSKLGANMDEYVMVGTRLKTDAKLDAMLEQNPNMHKGYNAIKDIHNVILGERFELDNVPYKITVTIKKA